VIKHPEILVAILDIEQYVRWDVNRKSSLLSDFPIRNEEKKSSQDTLA